MYFCCLKSQGLGIRYMIGHWQAAKLLIHEQRDPVVCSPPTEDAVHLLHRKWVGCACSPRAQNTKSGWLAALKPVWFPSKSERKKKKKEKEKSDFHELVSLFVNLTYL